MLLLGLFITLVLAAVGIAYYASRQYKTTVPALSEEAKHERRRKMFPRLDPTRSTILSVVIPCYNEQERLPPMLQSTVAYLNAVITKAKAGGYDPVIDGYEIIVVDDCSSDGTVGVATQFFEKAVRGAAGSEGATEPCMRVVKVNPNHGKGYAVRSGFFEACGDYVLMADGDNATEFADVGKLLKAIIVAKKQYEKSKNEKGKKDITENKNSSNIHSNDNIIQEMCAEGLVPAIAVGSRAHLERDAIARRTLFRTILMIAFHVVVNVTYCVATLGRFCPIRDTQCGFKLFDRALCEVLFRNNRLERWAFDVEILLLARRCGLGSIEVCVNWQEIPGSKVRLSGMVQMGLECLLMCFAYPLRLWEIRQQQKAKLQK